MKTVRELIAELQQEDQDAPVYAFYRIPTDYHFDTAEWDEMSPTPDEFRKIEWRSGAIDDAENELASTINDEVYEAMRKARN